VHSRPGQHCSVDVQVSASSVHCAACAFEIRLMPSLSRNWLEKDCGRVLSTGREGVRTSADGLSPARHRPAGRERQAERAFLELRSIRPAGVLTRSQARRCPRPVITAQLVSARYADCGDRPLRSFPSRAAADRRTRPRRAATGVSLAQWQNAPPTSLSQWTIPNCSEIGPC